MIMGSLLFPDAMQCALDIIHRVYSTRVENTKFNYVDSCCGIHIMYPEINQSVCLLCESAYLVYLGQSNL